MERAQPNQRPPSTVQELNAMRTVSEVMTSNINLDDLLNLILNKLVTTINADQGRSISSMKNAMNCGPEFCLRILGHYLRFD